VIDADNVLNPVHLNALIYAYFYAICCKVRDFELLQLFSQELSLSKMKHLAQYYAYFL